MAPHGYWLEPPAGARNRRKVTVKIQISGRGVTTKGTIPDNSNIDVQMKKPILITEKLYFQ